jgi:hypothetical protein
MKKIILVPIAAIVALGACDDVAPVAGPQGPNFELVSGGMDRANANVRIVASFTYTIEGNALPYRESGPAINPAGNTVGMCVEGGAMRNPAGKVTGARPHPHCMGGDISEELLISLEPIWGTHEIFCHHNENNCTSNDNRRAQLADKVTFNAAGTMFVTYNKEENHQARNWFMEGTGEIVAWAVDQHGNRHGTFTFNLNDFTNVASGSDADPAANLFDHFDIAREGEPEYIVWGLSKSITATYTYPDEVTTVPVDGWIHWDLIED